MLSEGDEHVPIAGAEAETPRPPSRTWSMRLWGVGALLALTMVASIVAGGIWCSRPSAARSAPGPAAAFLEQKSEEKAPPLLVYDALMWQSVLEVLLCRVPKVTPVLLADYARKRFLGEDYPGIEKQAWASPLRALLLLDLTPSEVAIIDLFHDNFFKQRGVKKVEVAPYEVPKYLLKPPDAWTWAQSLVPNPDYDRSLMDRVSDHDEPLSAVAYVATGAALMGRWVPTDFSRGKGAYLETYASFVRDEVLDKLRPTCERDD